MVQPTAATWYMGPSYDMRALPTPEVDMPLSYDRYGGVFQGLSGARTMDVTGHRSTYQLDFRYLTKSEWDFLQAMNMRHLPGPHYIINPLSKNRLSPQASMCQYRGTTDGPGVYSVDAVPQWQDGVFPAGITGFRSLRAVVWTATTTNGFAFDRGILNPILNGEQITCSVYAKADTATTGIMLIHRWDKFGALILPELTATTVSMTTSWQRFSVTHTLTSDVCSVTFEFLADTDDYPVNLAAAQMETGATATAWEIGGGSARVLVDQLSTSSHRYPLQDASLTLLET